MTPARNFLTHLRLPFQLLLTPFMLWGAVLAHGHLSWRLFAAFLIVTVCLYGGVTAFNSHYDRDEGPIGGLEHPPPPGPWLLPGSIVIQAIGQVLAYLVAPAFAWAYFVFAVWGVLYSHPLPRWKANPWLSWLSVMAFQGALGGVLGATAAAGHWVWTAEMPWGLVGGALMVGGLYPLSQLYQIEEDQARGDRTISIELGKRRSCVLANTLFFIGSLSMALAVGLKYHRVTFDVVLLWWAYFPLLGGVLWVSKAETAKQLFQRVSLMQKLAAVVFTAYTLYRLVGP